MIYCTGLELHALSSPTGTRYALGIVNGTDHSMAGYCLSACRCNILVCDGILQ